MPNRKIDKEMQTFEVFERNLTEEISVTTDFDLPLSVLVALIDDGWSEDQTRAALGALRVADLITAPTPEEVSIALPNTSTEDAGVVERRLRAAVPDARVGVTQHQAGDAVPDLLDRARLSATVL